MNYRSKNEPHECKNYMCPIHFEPIDDGIDIIKLLKEQNELLKKQNEMMKQNMCKCPYDGVLVNCPIHGINGTDRKYF